MKPLVKLLAPIVAGGMLSRLLPPHPWVTWRNGLAVGWALLAMGQFAAALVAIRRANKRLPLVRPAHGHDLADALRAGGLSVVIPARNEAETIASCLSAAVGAATTSSPVLRIVVVDDRSRDGTFEAVEAWAEARRLENLEDEEGIRRWRIHRKCTLELVPGRPLPEGWYGKPHALAQGAERCKDTRWLLFVDADTRLRTASYGALVGAANAHHLDLLSVLTEQELQRWWEKIFMPAVFGTIVLGYPPDLVNDPAVKDVAIANGQCLMVRASAYWELGGHDAVRGTIAEDQQLAAIFKQSGKTIMLADGRSLGSTRMYRSFGGFWEGWTKNMFQGLGGSLFLITAGAGSVLVSQVGPWLLAPVSLATKQRVAAAFWGGAIVANLALRRSTDRYVGSSPLWSMTQPIGSAGLVALLTGSAWKGIRGTTQWRGRTYDVRADRLPAGSLSLWRRIQLTLLS